jgi:DMSO/TMAO reductase YedYZ molybdopterin-dependent catalytic subunit
LVLEGADRGQPKEEPKPPGPISYARSIPRTKAMESNVLIAYQMNGRDLTPDHGYPLRAIVPGHYGMASVKWLTDIVSRFRATGRRLTTAIGMIPRGHLCAGRSPR